MKTKKYKMTLDEETLISLLNVCEKSWSYNGTENLINCTTPTLSWATYFEFQPGSHTTIARILTRLSVIPTKNELLAILKKETFKWPLRHILGNEISSFDWAMQYPDRAEKYKKLSESFTGAFNELTMEEFLKLKKRMPDFVGTLIRYAPDTFLPLLVGDNEISKNRDASTLLERRLKGENPNASILNSQGMGSR